MFGFASQPGVLSAVFGIRCVLCIPCILRVLCILCILCIPCILCCVWVRLPNAYSVFCCVRVGQLCCGELCWGGGVDWGVVGEPIRGGEEGCSGGRKGD